MKLFYMSLIFLVVSCTSHISEIENPAPEYHDYPVKNPSEDITSEDTAQYLQTKTICIKRTWGPEIIGCRCNDGTFSSSTGQGTCSWHDGVRYEIKQEHCVSETTVVYDARITNVGLLIRAADHSKIAGVYYEDENIDGNFYFNLFNDQNLCSLSVKCNRLLVCYYRESILTRDSYGEITSEWRYYLHSSMFVGQKDTVWDIL